MTPRLLGLAAVVLLSGLAAGYSSNLTPITLEIDGQARPVYTHQETVGALLLDSDLQLAAEDWVQPPPETLLEAGMLVRIIHAQPVWIQADGEQRLVRTHATDAGQIVQEAGVSLGAYDRAILEPLPASDSALRIRVERAIPITVHENGQSFTLHTTARTVGAALQEAGIALYVADRVEPGLGRPLSAGAHVYLDRSQPVTVHVDGRTIRTRTHRQQVEHVLADLDITLAGQDYAIPPLDTPLSGDTVVNIVRVSERFIIQQEPIPFEVVWQPDSTLEIDNYQVLRDGAPGVRERRYRIRYENGQEVNRMLENDYVAVPATDKIIGYGTNIVVRQLQTPQGAIEYWRVIRMYATSYSASTAGTPRDAPWYGRTAGGCIMDDGIVAVSTLVPWKTYVYVPGYGVGYACDRGGAIRGKRIDLGYADENLVLWHSWVDVYLMTPVPPTNQIDYRALY